MNLSVLHLSDLHRDTANPIANPVLLDSLVRDRERYTQDGVRAPDLIIASGDIIHGIPHDHADPDRALAQQYDEALSFLNQLAVEFVAGDKTRIILVPGNHDVSAYHFHASLRHVDIQPDRKKALVSQLFSPNSPLRWSWHDLALYEIADATIYDRRLAAYAAFYHTFYGTHRTFSLIPSEQFDLFDFPRFDLTVAGFCSCYNNDLFNRRGAIHPTCIAEAARTLRSPHYSGRLRLAVWHHNTEGLPMQSDYMNPGILQNLIDCGFSLGFHGHQHKPQHLDCRYRYGVDRRITVLSAGTLCGSAASRFARSYNIVELDVPAGRGRLHVREMQNDDLTLPIWGCRPLPPTTADTLEFTFDPAPPAPTPPEHDSRELLRAESLIRADQITDAIAVLLPLAPTNDLARPLLLECYVRSHDFPAIIQRFDPPQSPTEAIHLIDALWATGDRDRLRNALNSPAIANATDLSIVELRTKYAKRLAP